MSSRKMPQRYLYTVHEESGIPSTRTTCKNGETGRRIMAMHFMDDLMIECMKKKKKTLILSGDFRFRFSAVKIIFVGIFIYGRKWKMLSVGFSIQKSLGLLGLERILKSWSWSWKKSWLGLHHWCCFFTEGLAREGCRPKRHFAWGTFEGRKFGYLNRW